MKQQLSEGNAVLSTHHEDKNVFMQIIIESLAVKPQAIRLNFLMTHGIFFATHST
jgi:hypothetical protein